MKSKIVENEIIIALCESIILPQGATEITNAEYEAIIEIVRNKPQDTETIIYKLDAETLKYIPYDRLIEEVI